MKAIRLDFWNQNFETASVSRSRKTFKGEKVRRSPSVKPIRQAIEWGKAGTLGNGTHKRKSGSAHFLEIIFSKSSFRG